MFLKIVTANKVEEKVIGKGILIKYVRRERLIYIKVPALGTGTCGPNVDNYHCNRTHLLLSEQIIKAQ